MQNKRASKLIQPSRTLEESMRTQGIPSNANFTRADLLRDTYVPSQGSQPHPRSVQPANQPDG